MHQTTHAWRIVSLFAGSLLAGSIYAAALFYPLRSLCFLCLGQP
jgi:hypothetical protein